MMCIGCCVRCLVLFAAVLAVPCCLLSVFDRLLICVLFVVRGLLVVGCWLVCVVRCVFVVVCCVLFSGCCHFSVAWLLLSIVVSCCLLVVDVCCC